MQFDLRIKNNHELPGFNYIECEIYTDKEKKELAGKLSIRNLSVSDSEGEYSNLFHLMDSVDQYTYECWQALEEAGLLFNVSRVLILDRIQIAKKWRGNNLGIAAAYEIINKIKSNDALVATRIDVIQDIEGFNPQESDWDLEMDYMQLPQGCPDSAPKLASHFAKMGFSPANEDYMVLSKLQ
jgi:hypothetical protein